MKKDKLKNGFTLVELLAVVVILSIILAIAVPGAFGLIESSTKNAFKSNVKMVLKSIDYKLTLDDSYNLGDLNIDNLNSELMLSSDNYTSLVVSKNENKKAYITIVGKGKWTGLKACGTYEEITVVAIGDSACPTS